MGGCLWRDWINSTNSGRPIDDWEGSEEFLVVDEIGMLLDLDAGTLTPYTKMDGG